jgi:hypothetical protein
MLLEALVSCAGVTLRAVSTAIGIDLPDGSIVASSKVTPDLKAEDSSDGQRAR